MVPPAMQKPEQKTCSLYTSIYLSIYLSIYILHIYGGGDNLFVGAVEGGGHGAACDVKTRVMPSERKGDKSNLEGPLHENQCQILALTVSTVPNSAVITCSLAPLRAAVMVPPVRPAANEKCL